jgi:general secretion pathway protein G
MDNSTNTGSWPCPACGTALGANSQFCYKCGTAFRGGGPAQVKPGIPTAVKVGLIVALAVLALVVLLVSAALVVPAMLRNGDHAKVLKAHADISSFMPALASYKLDTGVYPTTTQGLRALREKPDGVKDWAGPYIQDAVPKDAWGHDYGYRFPGEHGDEPDIICYGADGQPGGDGVNADIVSWEKP